MACALLEVEYGLEAVWQDCTDPQTPRDWRRMLKVLGGKYVFPGFRCSQSEENIEGFGEANSIQEGAPGTHNGPLGRRHTTHDSTNSRLDDHRTNRAFTHFLRSTSLRQMHTTSSTPRSVSYASNSDPILPRTSNIRENLNTPMSSTRNSTTIQRPLSGVECTRQWWPFDKIHWIVHNQQCHTHDVGYRDNNKKQQNIFLNDFSRQPPQLELRTTQYVIEFRKPLLPAYIFPSGHAQRQATCTNASVWIQNTVLTMTALELYMLYHPIFVPRLARIVLTREGATNWILRQNSIYIKKELSR